MQGRTEDRVEELLTSLRRLFTEPTMLLRCWASYILLLALPVGATVSYKALAEILETSPRVIAWCMRRNRYAPLIPCHRVVSVNGELRGYSRGGPRVKKMLLKLEGVEFDDDRVKRVAGSSHDYWRLLEGSGYVLDV